MCLNKCHRQYSHTIYNKGKTINMKWHTKRPLRPEMEEERIFKTNFHKKYSITDKTQYCHFHGQQSITINLFTAMFSNINIFFCDAKGLYTECFIDTSSKCVTYCHEMVLWKDHLSIKNTLFWELLIEFCYLRTNCPLGPSLKVTTSCHYLCKICITYYFHQQHSTSFNFL